MPNDPGTGARHRDWMDHAVCRIDPDRFSDLDQVHEARLVCVVHCPVRTDCLAAVKRIECGAGRQARDGVVAGLAHNERYRLDPHVSRKADDAALLQLDGTEPCGSYSALLGHLWRGERIDPDCWSAEVRREHLNVVSAAAEPPPVPTASPTKAHCKGRTLKERHVYRLWSAGLPDPEIARRSASSIQAVRRIRDALGLRPNAPAQRAS